MPFGFAAYLWEILVWSLGLSLGGPAGYAMNPARAFGPRMARFMLPIAAKGKSDRTYAPIPILAPWMDAAIAAASIGVFQY
jgi:glycerol uptake facilitator protein